MKAIALVPHTKKIELIDWPEPRIETGSQVKVKVLQVGICGTDREEAAGGRADAPPGEKQLIIGHEMVGRVVEVGASVRSVKVNDWVVITVRRPCSVCEMCKKNCEDLCESGLYTERGIKQRHGFQAEFVVDEEKYLVKVPPDLKSLAVLTEPTTIVEKAVDRACRIQSAREPVSGDPTKWVKGKKVLVAGMGPVGLLGAMVLCLRGAKVYGLDRVGPETLRPKLLKAMGGIYLNGQVNETFDLIIDATGVAKLEFDLTKNLATNGIYAITGIPEDGFISIDGGELMNQLVLKNQVIFGSVNASGDDFKRAVADLAAAMHQWPGVIEQMITSRTPFTQFQEPFLHRSPNEIKAVIDWQ